MKRAITQIFTLLLLITLAVPAFAGKVLAEIEYFYADDGTLTGKAFNSKRVNFEYDLRGQLLAVKDAQGKDLERYTYDPAGNRLSKTINGLTTTYTYDKANQLVTSTVNGKTTHYKYDAAGRMIQAGDKKYIYNGQNKVAEVRQNGKTIAKFEYNIDGQIAKAIYGNKVEEFIWDGLALIWRSGVTYINEAYVTGGNPVMAGDDVLFNDMLGSTLAVNGKSVEMTSFGETGDRNAFFTGKPYIGELGYAFLFRNYRSNYGKWQTTDHLGYPDGWNNLAYVNNGVSNTIDNYGTTQHQLANGNFSTNTPGVYSYSMNFSAASLLTTYGWYNRNDTSVPFIFTGQMEPYGGCDIIGNYKVFDDGSISLLGDIIDYNWSGDIINDDPYDNQSFSTHGNISVYFSIGSSPIFSGEIETGINYTVYENTVQYRTNNRQRWTNNNLSNDSECVSLAE